MKQEIRHKVNLSCKHYGINDEGFRKELVDSYLDQYNDMIDNNFSKKEAYKTIVQSLDDLSVYNNKGIFQSSSNPKGLRYLCFSIHLLLAIFYIYSKSVSLFQVDYSVILYALIGLVSTAPIVIYSMIRNTGKNRIQIQYYLMMFLVYLPIGIYEVDGGIANSILLSILSYFTISVALGIIIHFIFSRKLSFQLSMVLLANIALFSTRFLYDYAIASFFAQFIAYTILFIIVTMQLWYGVFNQIQKKKILLMFLLIFLFGSVLEGLILAYSNINIIKYYSVALGVIVVFLVLFTYIFRNIKYWRFLYWASLIYLLILSFQQLASLFYQSINNDFNEATINFFSVQLSILAVFLFIVTLVLQNKYIERGK